MQDKFLIVICGPTATGKTDLSIYLANYYNTEIVSADSRQFYKELKTGVAAPNEEQLKSARHHLIGQISVCDYYNVSKYETEALTCINTIFSKNNIALLVGGSGLYIKTLCDGIDELPDPDPIIRNELNIEFIDKGIEYLQNKLRTLDPEYLAFVDKSNYVRLIRAIEVCLITGKKYSELRKAKPKKRNFNILKIGVNLDLNNLYVSINNRVDKMMSDGLLDEAKALLPFRNYNALNTFGYKELFEYFDNKVTLDEAIEKIKNNTRHYAKRQRTWFNKDKQIKWFNPENKMEIINYINSQITFNKDQGINS